VCCQIVYAGMRALGLLDRESEEVIIPHFGRVPDQYTHDPRHYSIRIDRR